MLYWEDRLISFSVLECGCDAERLLHGIVNLSNNGGMFLSCHVRLSE